eukprot:628567-Pelagomonas_calceolata.AAC.1
MECLQFSADIADLDDVKYSVDLASGYYQVDMDSNSCNTLDSIGEASITSLSSPIWSIYCPLVLQQDLVCCGSSRPYLDDFLFL